MIHIFWLSSYGVTLPEERKAEVQLRTVWQKLARIQALDPRPLSEPRPMERRLVGNCRDFSTFMAAALRSRGVPARARCGFGTYFGPDHFEDHWVCEYWRAEDERWVMVDPQLDAHMQRILGIKFDTLDMPQGQFVLAGQAWQMARRGEADPDHFGIFEYHGMDFIRGNVLRDLLALNKVEVLPWDFWGVLTTELAQSGPEGLALIDRLAELTLAGDAAFPQVRALYDETLGLRVPEDWLVRP